MLVTLSGSILNDVVTSASVSDIKVVDDLLEGCQQSVILADLGYLSQELKDSLEEEGITYGHHGVRTWKGLASITIGDC